MVTLVNLNGMVVTGIDNRKKEKGMTLLEALVSTAIIGIGFVAVFQMVNYSVQSIVVPLFNFEDNVFKFIPFPVITVLVVPLGVTFNCTKGKFPL